MPNFSDARKTYAGTLAFLFNREEIPIALNSRKLYGCGVEVGVQLGFFSKHLLDFWNGAHLISVDPWSAAGEEYDDIANVGQREHDRRYNETVERLAPYGDRSSIWRMYSTEAAGRIPHHSLDFVYLDARHDYEAVLEDLDAWYDRLRPGAVFAGHDYINGRVPDGEFGVKAAVDEYFEALDIPVHATLDDEPYFSWLVEVPAPRGLVAGAELEDETESAATARGPLPVAVDPDVLINLGFQAGGEKHMLSFKLDPDQMSQKIMIDALSAQSFYEPETSAFFLNVLEKGDTVLDVGTHVGYFSILAGSAVGPEGKVISFEPEIGNFRRLCQHRELNQFDHMEVVNAAVSDSSGKGSLFFNRDNDGGHALWDVGTHSFNRLSRDFPEQREIDIIRLDDHLAGRDLKRLKLIKIDVEGCELNVLRGARETIERTAVPYVVLEINDFGLQRMGTTNLELRTWMEELGYETYFMVPNEMNLIRMGLDQHVESQGVYNLMFRHPSAPALSQAA